MRRSFTGSLIVGLAAAGAVLAFSPAVAAADTVEVTTSGTFIDPDGNPLPSDSQYAKTYQITSTLPVEDGQARCTLTISAAATGKRVTSSSYNLRTLPDNGLASAVKRTSALKPGAYRATAACTVNKESAGLFEDSFTVVGDPAPLLAGTATCYDPETKQYSRPTRLDLVRGRFMAEDIRLLPAGAKFPSTSLKFSYKAYLPGNYAAIVGCGGVKGTPASTAVYTLPPAPATTLSLGGQSE